MKLKSSPGILSLEIRKSLEDLLPMWYFIMDGSILVILVVPSLKNHPSHETFWLGDQLLFTACKNMCLDYLSHFQLDFYIGVRLYQ